MDRIDAFFVIADVVRRNGDGRAQAALSALLEPPTAVPPTGVGAATHEARQLANQLHKTGLAGDWRTPPRHSEAMERLVHRLTCLLEAVMAMMDETAPALPPGYCPDCRDEHGGAHEG